VIRSKNNVEGHS